jgi:hypothetical protein
MGKRAVNKRISGSQSLIILLFCLFLFQVESQLNDEEIFPIKAENPFPKKFHSICSVIYKRFFRIYAHIYHAHFARLKRMGAEAHLNTAAKHFIFFCLEFDLVDQKEMEPLKELVQAFLASEAQGGTRSANSNKNTEESDSKGEKAPAS